MDCANICSVKLDKGCLCSFHCVESHYRDRAQCCITIAIIAKSILLLSTSSHICSTHASAGRATGTIQESNHVPCIQLATCTIVWHIQPLQCREQSSHICTSLKHYTVSHKQVQEVLKAHVHMAPLPHSHTETHMQAIIPNHLQSPALL